MTLFAGRLDNHPYVLKVILAPRKVRIHEFIGAIGRPARDQISTYGMDGRPLFMYSPDHCICVIDATRSAHLRCSALIEVLIRQQSNVENNSPYRHIWHCGFGAPTM